MEAECTRDKHSQSFGRLARSWAVLTQILHVGKLVTFAMQRLSIQHDGKSLLWKMNYVFTKARVIHTHTHTHTQ